MQKRAARAHLKTISVMLEGKLGALPPLEPRRVFSSTLPRFWPKGQTWKRLRSLVSKRCVCVCVCVTTPRCRSMLGKLPLTHMQHLLINAHKGNIYKGTKHKGTMSRQLVAAVKTVVQARRP